jgi:ubiquinone/menaquinone biosynthesis C-methylase UbiE
MTTSLRERIHEANIAAHRLEAPYYELLHPEVYGREEQKRINSILKTADHLVTRNRRIALDSGAGTGNLTGKLLEMGYTVTAVDISVEMCNILEKKFSAHLERGRLSVIHASVEEVNLAQDKFDLITSYSVLHHLPDYIGTVRKLSSILKKGGVMYLDHESSPFYWQNEKGVANLVKLMYSHSNPILNAIYFQAKGVSIPDIDYSLSDYWHKKFHALNHDAIRQVFVEENFQFSKRTDYHLKGTWIPNPLFFAYRHFCRPDMSSWIAKK